VTTGFLPYQSKSNISSVVVVAASLLLQKHIRQQLCSRTNHPQSADYRKFIIDKGTETSVKIGAVLDQRCLDNMLITGASIQVVLQKLYYWVKGIWQEH
jgi:hypothetical protein